MEVDFKALLEKINSLEEKLSYFKEQETQKLKKEANIYGIGCRSDHVYCLSLIESYLGGYSNSRIDRALAKQAIECSNLDKEAFLEAKTKFLTQKDAFIERLKSQDSRVKYLFLYSQVHHVRINDKVSTRLLLVATGVSQDGTKKVLGYELGEGSIIDIWKAFFKKLCQLGVSEVQLIIGGSLLKLEELSKDYFPLALYQYDAREFLDIGLNKLELQSNKEELLEIFKELVCHRSLIVFNSNKEEFLNKIKDSKLRDWFNYNLPYSSNHLKVTNHVKEIKLITNTALMYPLKKIGSRKLKAINVFSSLEMLEVYHSILLLETADSWLD